MGMERLLETDWRLVVTTALLSATHTHSAVLH